MKDAIKIILGFAIFFTVVILIGSAIGCGEPEARLTTLDELRGQDIDTLVLQPAALKVIPGRDWLTDSVGAIEQYGFYLLNQDFTNTRETIISSDTLLAWLRDSISGGGSQTLTYSNDSLYISGGNAIVITGFADTTEVNEVVDYINNLLAPAVQANITDIADLQDSATSHRTQINSLDDYRQYSVSLLSEIYEVSFPANSIITNRANNAKYEVGASSVSGYTTDSLLVIPTGSNYAVLMPERGEIMFSWLNQAGSDDTEVLRKMMQYAYVSKKISTVVIDEDAYLTDTLMIPATVSLEGTYKDIRTRTVGGKYSTLYLNLNDVTKNAITTESHLFAAAEQYFPGGHISNLNIEALSPGRAVFRIIRPGWMQIHDIRIGSGPTQPTNFSTRYYDYGFEYDDPIKTRFYDMEIKNFNKFGIYGRSGGGTTYFDNVRVENAVRGFMLQNTSIKLTNCIVENMDSIGLDINASDVVMDYCYFETVPNSAVATQAIELDGGSASLTMRSSRFNSPYQTPDAGLVAIRTGDFDYLWAYDCEFHNYPAQISTTADQGNIFWQNEYTTGIGSPIRNYSGVTDTTKLFYQSSSKASFPGDIYVHSLVPNRLTMANAEKKLASISYATVADSVGEHLAKVLENELDEDVLTNLNNNTWYINDDPGGKVVIGATGASGEGLLEVIGGRIYGGSGVLIPNSAFYYSKSQSGSVKPLMRYTATDNIEIGESGGNLNNLKLNAGSASSDHIIFTAGFAERARITGSGELMVGRTTSAGSFIGQFEGDVYINDVLKLNPSTEPGSPEKGMLYSNDSDNHLYYYNGTTWVQLD